MKSTKKMLCFVLAIAVMVGSMGLVSSFANNTGDTGATTVGLTGDPEYVLKFTQDVVNSSKLLTLNDMRSADYFNESDALTDEFVKSDAKSGMKVDLNSNNSITMTKSSVTDGSDYQYSTILEVPVTAEMKANYLKATDKKLYISYWLSDCQKTNASGVANGVYTTYQFRIYTKFKTAYQDGDYARKIKLSSLGKHDIKMYQQNLGKSFKLLGGDGKALDNLDNVDSIIFCLYSFNKNVQATMNLSGITYAGVPEINEFVKPTPGSMTEYMTFGGWSKNLLLDYANTPNPIKYCSAGGYNAKDYKTLNQEGWLYFNNTTKVPEWQLNTSYNVDPVAFNKAIVTTNQPGAESKIKIKCYFPKIEDTEGKPMQGEFQVAFNTFQGKTYNLTQTFISPGYEYVFEMDSTVLDVNQVSTVRIALMAFWNYDPVDDVYYDMGRDQFAKRYDKDGNLMTPVYEDPKDTATFKGYKIEGSDTLLSESDVAKITTACSDGRKDVDVTAIKDRFKMRTMQNVEAFISPFYTDGGTGLIPTTTGVNGETAPTTTVTGAPVTGAPVTGAPVGGGTTVADGTQADVEQTGSTGEVEYEHAGYHVFDFKAEAYAETYGAWTHASFANFFFEDYYESYEIVDYDIEKDGIKQGFKDRKNPMVKVEGDEEYKKDFEEAKSLASGGYQLELSSPYPRRQEQHQAYFHSSGAGEDARLTNNGAGDHINQTAQGETYDYAEQIAKGIEYAKAHPNPTQNGYLAIDVFVKDCTHGYKNVYDKYKYQSEVTYKNWCKKNGKKCENEKSPIQFVVGVLATTDDGEAVNAKVMEFVQYNEKKTLYIDVSELEPEWIYGVSIAAQNYSHLANREQGGDNLSCGITDVKARFSALYIPGSKNSDLTTTIQVTEALNMKDVKNIKKLYDALPGLDVDDYETEEDYNKLAKFIKAWSKASDNTQKYCAEEYGIDYSEIGMLEMDVYDKIYGSGWYEGDESLEDDDDFYSPGTSDMAFPMVSLLLVGLSGYVIVKTRKKKEEE